jgi:hypothetical protein
MIEIETVCVNVCGNKIASLKGLIYIYIYKRNLGIDRPHGSSGNIHEQSQNLFGVLLEQRENINMSLMRETRHNVEGRLPEAKRTFDTMLER